jgi:hypothetical protein
MSTLFSKPKVPEIKTPAPPQPEAEAVEEARNKVKLAAMRARGRESTLLTGGMGVSGAAPVQRKVLLGE